MGSARKLAIIPAAQPASLCCSPEAQNFGPQAIGRGDGAHCASNTRDLVIFGKNHFWNAMPEGEGLQVTLLEGLVSVSGGGAGGDVILSPGEQLQLRSSVRTVSRVDGARAQSWTTGMVPFTDATLAAAADEMNRYSAIKLRIDGPVAGERISGSFRAGDQDAFAAALEAFMPVVSERRGDEIIVRGRD
jgi:ferric-dicitrate binding protein FerR (iron transport regulator)